MLTNSHTEKTKIATWHRLVRGALWALLFVVGATFFLTTRFSNDNSLQGLEVGSVAPRDIVAPDQLVYVSNYETEAERERARKSVSTVYTPPDPKVARQQVDRLRKIFDYIDTVRADPYGTLAEKSEWIAAIPDLTLPDSVIDQILIMNDQAWNETKQEALQVLDQAMRTEIRENQVLLTRRQLPARIALDTPDEQASVIVAITEDLIKPNTFPDESRTQAEREAAAEAVKPSVVTFEKNELIVAAGEVIGPKEMEAIQALGLLEPRFSWAQDFLAPFILILITTIIASAYVAQHLPHLLVDRKRLPLLAVLLLAFVAIARFMIPESAPIAFLYPIAALTMMLVVFIDVHLAFIAATLFAALAGYLAGENSLVVTVYLILSGWTGILSLGKGQRVTSILWAGVYVGLVNVVVIVLFNLPTAAQDVSRLGVLVLIGLLNGVFSAALALLGLFAIGNMLGITTAIQLMDLARPTHPLLRKLLLKAPGTYHHSLMVSNLAEQAADRVGADSLLVRVMAYYHDVGKIQRPYFFIENQPEGINVHEKLDPQISAQIIIGHVTDGLKLAEKYRLPQSIKDGISQHHGTSLVKYFYYQALEAAEKDGRQINEADFRYPGPKPQTRETGILMLADVSESTVRALKPASAEELDEIVQKVIADKLNSGELNECHLTIADLYQIRTAFVDILQGVHHPRIKYPDQVAADKAAEKPPAEVSQSGTGSADGSTAGKASPPPLPPSGQRGVVRPATLIRRE
ncbi:MAG: HDIG domain-containing protein [Chloroflexi bacterium]|nr:MAG: HDIG domain-containing protein [Chloroflexota bacterium]